MDLILNEACSVVPEKSVPLPSQGSALLNLLASMGYSTQNPPLSDLLRQVQKLDGDWYILSPVYWQATHNDALIVASGSELELSDEDSRTFCKSYANYLAQEGLELQYFDAYHWLLGIDKQPALHANPVHHIQHKSLMPELAKLDDTLYWQKFFTESQMFFAAHGFQSSINGIWAWSTEKLGEKKSIAICCEAEFLAFAELLSTNITLYEPNLVLNRFQIVILNNPATLSPHHQEALQKIPCHWYWNNVAYASKSNHWFTRLWRSLTHAY